MTASNPVNILQAYAIGLQDWLTNDKRKRSAALTSMQYVGTCEYQLSKLVERRNPFVYSWWTQFLLIQILSSGAKLLLSRAVTRDFVNPVVTSTAPEVTLRTAQGLSSMHSFPAWKATQTYFFQKSLVSTLDILAITAHQAPQSKILSTKSTASVITYAKPPHLVTASFLSAPMTWLRSLAPILRKRKSQSSADTYRDLIA